MSQLTSFVIAGIQCDPRIARPDLNLEMIADLAADARDAGAKLAIFPECAVSGYCFDSLEEALEVAEPVPGEHEIHRLNDRRPDQYGALISGRN